MMLKNETLKCFFVSNPDSPYFQSGTFLGILQFLQKGTNKAKLKQVGKNGILVVEEVKTMKGLYNFLKRMEDSLD
jgi:transcription-repair coupling factor (superfamily II helicase)